MGIPDHLTCLLRHLYVGQEATVRTLYGTTDWFKIKKEVWKGCLLSPCLFNVYAEHIMWNARLDELQAGIKIARRNITNLINADDTTLMAESEKELKSLLMKMKEWGLKKLDTTEQLSTHAWGSEWEMPIGSSCYIFCFNLTVLNLDWSLELPLFDSAWDVQICSYQCHKNTFENKWRVAQESLETSWVSRCTFLFKDLIWRKILNSSGTKTEA